MKRPIHTMALYAAPELAFGLLSTIWTCGAGWLLLGMVSGGDSPADLLARWGLVPTFFAMTFPLMLILSLRLLASAYARASLREMATQQRAKKISGESGE